MEWLSRLRNLVRNLFGHADMERDLDDEVVAFAELLAEEKVKRGMTHDDARRAARIEMGGVSQIKEDVRSARSGAWLYTLWQDLRHGARILRNHPGFTLTSVLTFTIGIGANTAIFSMVNAFLLRPVPVESPRQLTYLVQKNDERPSNVFSYPDFEDIRNQSRGAFSDLAATHDFHMDGFSRDGKNQTIWNSYVTTNFFSLMGVRPALGSLIVPEQGSLAGANPVIVLSHAFWKTHLAADANVIGRQASINGHPVTIIGVLPEGFHGASNLIETQGFLPLGAAEALAGNVSKGHLFQREEPRLLVFARLRRETSLSQARSTLAVIANRLADQYPKMHKTLVLEPVPLGSGFLNSTGENPLGITSTLFLILAGLVLLLAAANVANLLLVRAMARNREMALRSALGAARARLVRQVLTETLLLALLGCAGGVLFGMGASHALSSLPLQTDFPVLFDFHFDWRVFAYAFAATLVVAAAGGLVPAWRATGVHLTDVMRESGRGASPRRQRFRSVLVISQVAGSLMLLIVAGLFVRSLQSVQRTDLGFHPHQVTNVSVDVHQAGYDEAQGREFFHQLLEHVQSLPGVESASLAQTVPFGLESLGASLKIEGFQEQPGKPKPAAGYNTVSPGYFKTLRVPILRGREFLDSDNQSAARVAVINQALAERYWPGQDPIGRQFIKDDDSTHSIQVVGVVRNFRSRELTAPIEPFFFMPLAQSYVSRQTLQVRASTSSTATMKALVGSIHSLEPVMPVFDVQTMNQVMQGLNAFFLYRLAAAMAGALGLVGLVLAIVGVYGVVSYSAAQRTHEIGVRMALGARPAQVVKTIFRQGLIIVSYGLLFGILAAMAIAKLVGSFLSGVSPVDPLTYVGVALLLATIALTASFLPARRAMRVDPMVALRYE